MVTDKPKELKTAGELAEEARMLLEPRWIVEDFEGRPYYFLFNPVTEESGAPVWEKPRELMSEVEMLLIDAAVYVLLRYRCLLPP